MIEKEPPKLWKGCLGGVAAIFLICSYPFLLVAQLVSVFFLGIDVEDEIRVMMILLPVLGGVIGVVCLLDMLGYTRMKIRYNPPVAPPPLPRTQSEECSNQEEEKIQPGKED